MWVTRQLKERYELVCVVMIKKQLLSLILWIKLLKSLQYLLLYHLFVLLLPLFFRNMCGLYCRRFALCLCLFAHCLFCSVVDKWVNVFLLAINKKDINSQWSSLAESSRSAILDRTDLQHYLLSCVVQQFSKLELHTRACLPPFPQMLIFC